MGIIYWLLFVVCWLCVAGISWLLIYRTPEYQKNKREVERLQAKGKSTFHKLYSVDTRHNEFHGTVDAAKKETHSIDKKKVKQKQLQKNEKDLQQINMKLTMTKMKSFFFLMLLMVASYALLNSLYEGQPVVQLPFTPIGFIQGLSHRGLSGEDYTQGSAVSWSTGFNTEMTVY